ncbi:MAG: tetratricopeptide repeat protein [Anaerolineae bacterium]|nr:tetratricopeptide repeat protein [Anaerolineae bacterium]
MNSQRLGWGFIFVLIIFLAIWGFVEESQQRSRVSNTFYPTQTPDAQTIKNNQQATEVAQYMSETATQQAGHQNIQIQTNPHNADLYFYRAMSHIYAENYARAIFDLDRAIQLGNTSFELYMLYEQRADAYAGLEMYQLAVDDYTRAIKLVPENTSLYYARAYVYEDMGAYPLAIADFNHILSIEPDDEYVYRGRGRIYEAMGDYQQAIADFTQAITLNPRFTSAYINRGNVYLDLEDYIRARADYESVLEIDPRDEVAHLNMGVLYDHLDDDESAFIYYTRAIELDPQYAYAYLYRGRTLYALGDYARALQDWAEYERLVQETLPIDYEPLRRRAYAQLGQ